MKREARNGLALCGAVLRWAKLLDVVIFATCSIKRLVTNVISKLAQLQHHYSGEKSLEDWVNCVKYVYGGNEESERPRGRKRKWSGWEI